MTARDVPHPPLRLDAKFISLQASLVISYLALRTTVGILGIAFPIVLSVGCRLFGGCQCIEVSLSAYYGTEVRNIFVGLLFAIALFLFSYKGYERQDDWAGKGACVFAVGVALFPATSEVSWIRGAHYVFAGSLFLTFSYFSIALFTKTDPDAPPTPQKRKRNTVYVVCGVVIIACIVLIAVNQLFLSGTAIASIRPVFWLESIALWAFGLSWMTKGEALAFLNDHS